MRLLFSVLLSKRHRPQADFGNLELAAAKNVVLHQSPVFSESRYVRALTCKLRALGRALQPYWQRSVSDHHQVGEQPTLLPIKGAL